jgi:HEAT repeat protein
MGLLPALSDDTSHAFTFSLAQMRTDKAYSSLAAIVTDKTRSDKLRQQALMALGQNRDQRAITALENILTGDSDPRTRTQALQLLENLLRRR